MALKPMCVCASVVIKTFLKKLEIKTKTFAQNSTIKFHFKSNKCIRTHSGTFCCTLQCTSNSLQYYTNVHFQLHANHCHCQHSPAIIVSTQASKTRDQVRDLHGNYSRPRPSPFGLETKTKTLIPWSRDQDRDF